MSEHAYVAAAIDEMLARLRGAAAVGAAQERRARVAAAMDGEPALLVTARRLGLTDFERELLLCCAAAQLDTRVAAACAAVHGAPLPSYALAASALDDAQWCAMTPGRPLRRLRILELGDGPLAACPLTLDERLVHHLLGLGELDARLQPTATPLVAAGPLPPSQEAVAAEIARLWRAGDAPVVQISGPHRGDIRAVLAARRGRGRHGAVRR